MATDTKLTLFKWDIDNLSDVIKNSDCTMRLSKQFSLNGNSNVQFSLFLDTKKNFTAAEFVGIKVRKIPEATQLEVNIRFWLEGDGRMFNAVNLKKCKFNAVNDRFWFKVKPGTDESTFSRIYNNSQSLIICCELEPLDLPSVPAQTTKSLVSNSKHDLGRRLWNLYQKGHSYDAIVQVGGKEFKIMSAVFMSHSEVFEQMFTSNFVEGAEKRIDMEDVSVNVMEAFIRWMYTGEIEDESTIEELFSLADKYIVWDLKSQCATLMFNNLNQNNAAKRLALSVTHNDKSLEEHVLNFVAQLSGDKIKEVFESDAWCDYLVNKRRFCK